jgi:FkbM family methyltransferase
MKTFAQYGEDAIIEGVIARLEWITGEDFNKKTYLDIGGFHPEIHSVLFHFYQERGWRGSIFEPNTIHNADFFRQRPFDNLHNYAVAGTAGLRTFLIFSDGDSSNTISEKFAEAKESAQDTPITHRREVMCITLDDAMRLHEKSFFQGPFLVSIDAEGSDFDIIAHYSFTSRPLLFLIENDAGQSMKRTPLTRYMTGHGYRPVAATVMTTLFMNEKSPYFHALSKIGQK